MKGRRSLAPAIIITAVIVAALYDCGKWEACRAYRMFRTGDLTGCLSAWSALQSAPGQGKDAVFNMGVAEYRMGNYSAAVGHFRVASLTDEIPVRARAMYNLGTTRIQLSSRVGALPSASGPTVAGDRDPGGHGPREHLREAVAALRESVSLNPSDGAAINNLKVAETRLAALTGAGEEKASGQQPKPRQRGTEQTGMKGREAKERNNPASKPAGATKQDQEGAKRRRVALDQQQALRMLDDARGRESLRSSVAAKRGGSPATPPEKDW